MRFLLLCISFLLLQGCLGWQRDIVRARDHQGPPPSLPVNDARCRVTHYQVGADVVPVVYADFDAFWEYYPQWKPYLESFQEAHAHAGIGIDPYDMNTGDTQVVWTDGIYDRRAHTIWIVGRFDRAKNLTHEIAHWQEDIHGWDVGRWYWLREYYANGSVGDGDAYSKLFKEKGSLAMTMGWWVPDEVKAHTHEAVLIDGTPPKSGQVIEWNTAKK